MILRCVHDDIVTVPMLNPRVPDQLGTNAVDRDVAASAELLTPIFERLLVDVVFAALAWNSRREHYKRAVRRQRIDKASRPFGREMLGDFEALNQVEAPSEIDRLAEIRDAKPMRSDHQISMVDVGAVNAHHGGAGRLPHAEPGAAAALVATLRSGSARSVPRPRSIDHGWPPTTS